MTQLDIRTVPVIQDRAGPPAARTLGVLPALTLATTLAVTVGAGLWGSHASGGPGPLLLTNGSRPVVATTGIALNSVSGQTIAVSMPISTGQASIVLESAAIIPLPGYPTPQLTDLGVYFGPASGPAATQGWPPQSPDTGDPATSGKQLAVAPLAGARVGPSRVVGGVPNEYFLYFGVKGRQTGVNYVVAGLRVVYRVGGAEYVTNLYQMGEDCVRSSLQATWSTDMNALSTEVHLYG
ncbi:MAG TPA: hypothetical protein VGX23_34390 [Actinocrinis sp.]|nr:hypothetical protein [Actinocrinis sp.]